MYFDSVIDAQLDVVSSGLGRERKSPPLSQKQEGLLALTTLSTHRQLYSQVQNAFSQIVGATELLRPLLDNQTET